MQTTPVTMVRIYITEGSKLLHPIISYLEQDAKVRGISVFRAISGWGSSGTHETNFMDLSLNLPLAIEFFDEKDKVKSAVEYLATIVKMQHIVIWNAEVVLG